MGHVYFPRISTVFITSGMYVCQISGDQIQRDVIIVIPRVDVLKENILRTSIIMRRRASSNDPQRTEPFVESENSTTTSEECIVLSFER